MRWAYFQFLANAFPLSARTRAQREDRLFKGGPAEPAVMCAFCGQVEEERKHVFLACSSAVRARDLLARPFLSVGAQRRHRRLLDLPEGPLSLRRRGPGVAAAARTARRCSLTRRPLSLDMPWLRTLD